jgi:hypothetical protein
LAAFREKDREFAAALIGAGLVDPVMVRDRLVETEGLDPVRRTLALSWLDGRIMDLAVEAQHATRPDRTR